MATGAESDATLVHRLVAVRDLQADWSTGQLAHLGSIKPAVVAAANNGFGERTGATRRWSTDRATGGVDTGSRWGCACIRVVDSLATGIAGVSTWGHITDVGNRSEIFSSF